MKPLPTCLAFCRELCVCVCACSVGGFIALKFCLLRQTMHSRVKGCDACVVYSLLWLCEPQWKQANNHCDVNNGVNSVLKYTLQWSPSTAASAISPNSQGDSRIRKKERSEKHFVELQHSLTHEKQLFQNGGADSSRQTDSRILFIVLTRGASRSRFK